MFAAPILIDRSMTNYSAGMSGNGNRIKSKMAVKYRDKRTFITTVRDQYPSYDIFLTHLSVHYPLPLTKYHRTSLMAGRCCNSNLNKTPQHLLDGR
jgi:hypothetical protein